MCLQMDQWQMLDEFLPSLLRNGGQNGRLNGQVDGQESKEIIAISERQNDTLLTFKRFEIQVEDNLHEVQNGTDKIRDFVDKW